MIRVACIYTTPHFSGAAMSLVEALRTLASDVRPTFLTPRGSASSFFERSGLGSVFGVSWLSQFDHTRFGRYRGVRWLVALRELVMLPTTWLEVRRFAEQSHNIELIHLNEITGIVPAVLLKRRLQVPLVVHVRAHMGDQSRGWRTGLLWRLIDRHADAVICIDETVRRTLPSSLTRPVHVIHNALGIKEPASAETPPLPVALSTPEGRVRVGIVGSLLRVKGIYEFVQAAISICRQREDVVFAIVGSGVRRLTGLRGFIVSQLGLAEDVEADARRAIDRAGLAHRILMTGHRSDVVNVYRHLDVLCFPSYYDAPGRPIFEAAYFGKPSIVAISDPTADTLVDGVTGLAIAARDSRALEQAIQCLVDQPQARQTMGEAARALAMRNFDLQTNAGRLLLIYRQVLGH